VAKAVAGVVRKVLKWADTICYGNFNQEELAEKLGERTAFQEVEK